MSLRFLGPAGPILLLLTIGCQFEAPPAQGGPDFATNPDLGPQDGPALDAELDGGIDGSIDTGFEDAEPADVPDADATAADVPGLDAGLAPVAVAGPDQLVCPTALVRLDGRGSSGDGLGFSWSQTLGPSIVFADANAALTSFTAPSAGILELQLEVSNALGADTDGVRVEVEAAPVLELGPPRRMISGALVEVSASSATIAGSGATFTWTQLSGPTLSLQNADTATVSFVAPNGGDEVELELTITSSCGQSASDRIILRVNQAPLAEATALDPALPLDTVLLDATESSDLDNDPLLYEWTLLSGPPGHNGGFEPFPGTGNASSLTSAPLFYPTVPGLYFLEVTVSDGLETDALGLVLEVVPFEFLPYSTIVTPTDSRAIAVRAIDGHVFVGTQTGAQEMRLASNDVVNLGCIDPDQVTVVRAAPGGQVYFGFNNERRITELAAGGGCVSQTHDPGSVLSPNPAATRDLLVTASGDFYAATNAGTAFFSRTTVAFTTEIVFSALGGSGSDYAAAGVDGSGSFWFGSRETNTARDGAVRVADPLTAPTNSPRQDFLTGSDDIHSFVAGLVALPASNEFWVLTRTRGVLQIADADNPTSFQQYTIQNGGLPPALLQDEMTRGAYDVATQDLWIAMRSGLARYKRDAGAFVAIPLGVLGITGRVYDIAFDPDPTRGRRLYVATQDGALQAVLPP